MATTRATLSRLLALCLAAGCASDWTYASDAEAVAPGGRVRAVRFGATAGGAAGACRRGLLVLPAGSAAPTAAELRAAEDSAVFVSNCYGGLGFRWVAPDTLAVSYAPDSMTVTTRRAIAANGAVYVTYGARP